MSTVQRLYIRRIKSSNIWRSCLQVIVFYRESSSTVQTHQSQSLSSSSTVARFPCLMPFCFGSFSSTCLLVKRESPTFTAPSPVRSFSTSAIRSAQRSAIPYAEPPTDSPSVFVLSPCNSFKVTICLFTSPSLYTSTVGQFRSGYPSIHKSP